VEAHDRSDDEQTFAVVTEWTVPPARDGAPHRAGAGDAGPSDAELIERSRREPDCFAAIFDRHAAEILRYVHARLGPDLAEDVTAETFLAAFRRRRLLQTAPADRGTEDPGDRSADLVTAQQLRPQLAAVLNGLPARDRELLLLIAWAGLTYEESAQALGISTGAVRSRLNRIQVRTRHELGGANPARLHEENDHG
jgi:DNA-directed RNA polymerase specialized sigma24 family protein